MPCVYVLVRESSQDDIRYVGITKNEDPLARFSLHKTRLKSGSALPLYAWMRKYDDVMPIAVASGLSWQEACSMEIEMIARLKSEGHRLLNCTAGGEGFIDLSEESRAKLASTWLGRKHSDEAKKKMSIAKKGKTTWNKGVPMSEAAKKKLSESKKGKTLTAEHKKKISESGRGRKHSTKAKEKIGRAHRGKIVGDETRSKLSKSLKGKQPWNKGLSKDEQEARRNQNKKGNPLR